MLLQQAAKNNFNLPCFTAPFGEDFGFSVKTALDLDNIYTYPEEIKLLTPKAVPKRRREFCLGRAAARSALSQLCLVNFPVVRGKYSEPLWPEGVVGSITHSGDVAVAAVAHRDKSGGIGVDVEKLKKNMPFDIAPKVCSLGEMNWVKEVEHEKYLRLALVFSAKESAFKAFFPIEHVFLGFHDAELFWDRQRGIFRGRLLKKAGSNYLKGYYFEVGCQVKEDYVFTYMTLPPV